MLIASTSESFITFATWFHSKIKSALIRCLARSILSALGDPRFHLSTRRALRDSAGFFLHGEDARLLTGVQNLESFSPRWKRQGLEFAHHALDHMSIPSLHDALVPVNANLAFWKDAHSRILSTALALGDEVFVSLGRKRQNEQDQTQEGCWLQGRTFLANYRET
jgi:hypothetical protein